LNASFLLNSEEKSSLESFFEASTRLEKRSVLWKVSFGASLRLEKRRLL
jgi:hypothetical protein